MDEKIYIFGAHSRAQTLAVYLQALYPEMKIEAFLYNNEEKNPKKIGGIPVLFLDEGKLCTEFPIYIGTRGIYHEDLTERLRNVGFEKIYPVTVELDLRIRNEYLKKYFADSGEEFAKIENLENAGKDPSAVVYVARSAYDRPLKAPYEPVFYEKEIQAGAVLTAERLAEGILTDAGGDNISDRNRQFCELTALYWIWKNAREDIVGLAHYRRHFILPEDWKERMLCNQVDVILPVPLYVAPDLEENYKARHEASDWEYMMECVKEQDMRMYRQAVEFFKGNLYSPCNMLIARREVLDELCVWLFPILFKAAEHGGQKEDGYQNRYPGFLSERLITFFFHMNKGRFKVVYADKNFLQ